MRVATVDGLVTLYYDGSKELINRELNTEWNRACDYNEDADIESLDLSVQCKQYLGERLSWQQIIILEGVTEIPEWTFFRCFNIRRVIFSNTVIRIQRSAFCRCKNLVYIKLSISLEYIRDFAFGNCNLSSVFVPQRCREIGDYAFKENKNLSIFHFPQEVELGTNVIFGTALAEASPFYTTTDGRYGLGDSRAVNQWLKNINNDEKFALHRACASFQPLKEVIHAIILQKGLKAFREENSAGINPSRYLKENPYTELTEKEIIHDYLMKMIGDVV